MSVRKRAWTTRQGESREAWIVDYTDQQGARHIQTFARKKDADTYQATVKVDMRHGLHTAPSKSVTVAEAGAAWIASGEGNGLERATLVSYRQHLRDHIVPYIGNLKLAQLTVPLVREFMDRLRKDGRSPAMVRRTIGDLGRYWPTRRSGALWRRTSSAASTRTRSGGRASGGRRRSSGSARTSRRRRRLKPLLPASKGAGAL